MESQIKNLYFFFLLFWSLQLSGQSALFINGKIISDFSKPQEISTQMMVLDGRVSEIGNKLRVPPEIQRWDLKGQWVIPALTDSHAHVLATGQKKRVLNLQQKSIKEILELVAQKLREEPNSKIISGFGWDQTQWPNQSYPQIELLDKLSQEIPIVLYRIDGHAAWVNSVALRKAQLLDTHKKTGNPRGILVDEGLKAIEEITPSSTIEEIERDIKEFVKTALSFGITEVHDAGISRRDYLILKELIKKEDIPFRFFEMASFSTETEIQSIAKTTPERGLLNDRLTLQTVKIYLDGAMGSRGALFSTPYDDALETSGVQLITEKKLEELMQLADSKGFQIAIHAIGDKANQIAVEAAEKLFKKQSPQKRIRIEHAQVLSSEIIKKMGELKLIASMQPFHCASDSKWLISRIGKSRARFAYPWRSLIQAGAPLAFGSDSPIEDLNPAEGLEASVKRSLFPEEKISLEEAFQAYTAGAAYASFQENNRGTLTPGKWADFILLKENPLKTQKTTSFHMDVLATFFAGRLVYKKK